MFGDFDEWWTQRQIEKWDKMQRIVKGIETEEERKARLKNAEKHRMRDQVILGVARSVTHLPRFR